MTLDKLERKLSKLRRAEGNPLAERHLERAAFYLDAALKACEGQRSRTDGLSRGEAEEALRRGADC